MDSKLDFEIIFWEGLELRKIVHCIFSEYSQREQTIESPSALRGTVNPSLEQLGHLVKPLIIGISYLNYFILISTIFEIIFWEG